MMNPFFLSPGLTLSIRRLARGSNNYGREEKLVEHFQSKNQPHPSAAATSHIPQRNGVGVERAINNNRLPMVVGGL